MTQRSGRPGQPQQPGQPGPEEEGLQVLGYQPFRAPEGHAGQGILVLTSRGNIFTLFHPTTAVEAAVIWVWGARGGVSGPAGGIFRTLAEELAEEGVASLRLDYRFPNHLYECVLDVLAGTSLLEGVGFKRLALVGHSFGGAVAIAAAPFTPTVVAVAGLSCQNAGAEGVADVAPRPLLLAHGMDDVVIPVTSSQMIYDEAKEPKEFRVFQGAGHGLTECKQELHDLLMSWLVKHLRDSPPPAPPPPALFHPGDPEPGGPPPPRPQLFRP